MRNKIILLLVIALFVAFPFFVSPYMSFILFLLFTCIVLAQSFDIQGGYAGYINLGNTSFFGIGAYAFAILSKTGLPFPLAVIAAPLLSAVVGLIVGIPLFRLRGSYFAITTFAFSQLMLYLARNLSGLTGGVKGIMFLVPGETARMATYYAALVFAIACSFLSYRLSKSRFGLALMTIREDEEVAQVFGVNATRYKLQAIMLSASIAGLMGVIYMIAAGMIMPDTVFGLEMVLIPPTAAILGGMGFWLGPILGAIIMQLISELIFVKMVYFHLFTYGMILLLAGLYMPGGIVRAKIFQRMLKT